MPTTSKIVLGSNLVAREIATSALVNLAGNYDYLSQGYYASQDLELSGQAVRPTCEEMLDAYIPPLMLEKARRLGVAIPNFYMSNGYFEPPAVVDPVNPFTLKGRIVLKSGHAKSIAKSLTRNFTYVICCQDIPAGSKIRQFRSVLGWSVAPAFRAAAKVVWEKFSIPLAKVRLIVDADGNWLLSDISPLFMEDLGKREKDYLMERVAWDN